MVELIATLEAALVAGINPISAIKEATGYSLEQLAVISGLATSEIAELEAGDADPAKLARLGTALGLPAGLTG